MIQASCLCGDVTWEMAGPFLFMSHCHCSRCRKSHGTPFATYVPGPTETLELNGADGIACWESSPGFQRTFCRTCGSKVPGRKPYQGLQFVAAGNLDGDPGRRPEAHIFATSKASWYELPADDLARFDTYPAGVESPVLLDREPPDRPGNGIRGSCACQEVTFRVIEPPLRAHNCHCRRCRKARSAAFASNMFVQEGGVVFTRGRENVATFNVPAVDRFTQAFCITCGSAMPFSYHERGVTVVPMGALDDDPGITPQAHIFVGSKAPWYEIRDTLPQFAGYPT